MRISQLYQRGFFRALCFVFLSWSSIASAVSLGSPQLQSRPGEPLRVEIPIRITLDETSALDSLKVALPGKASYDRLGVSQKILELNPQAMVYRNRAEQLMVLVETVQSVPMTDDPFLDVLLTLSWSSGSITKTFTLLIGDAQKVVVKPGQTLSEIALLMVPSLDGATLDQTIMALYKENPDAFASGSINRLLAGAELNRPSQALLRSISPAEANQFVADANEQWLAEQAKAGKGAGDGAAKSTSPSEPVAQDRLKIGSGAESSDKERRYAENLLVQEKELEQANARVAELEKNIADLQRLLDKAGEKNSIDRNLNWGSIWLAIVISALVVLAVFLLWFFNRHSKRVKNLELRDATHSHSQSSASNVGAAFEMPDRAKALFAGLNLDLSKPSKASPEVSPSIKVSEDNNSLHDTLRVKLNLARAYITIEDFAAAKKSLEEVLVSSNTVDPAITIEAQGLLSELAHRQV